MNHFWDLVSRLKPDGGDASATDWERPGNGLVCYHADSQNNRLRSRNAARQHQHITSSYGTLIDGQISSAILEGSPRFAGHHAPGRRNHYAVDWGGERTVKNWLAGVSGPNGQHLVDLIRHSDDVMEVLLTLAERQQIVAAQKLVDVRNKLAEIVGQIDELMGNRRLTGGE